MSQVSNYCRSQRRTAWAFLAAYALIAAVIVGCAPGQAESVSGEVIDATGARSHLIVSDTRICATVVVYIGASSDAWDQRAALAQAALNSFDRSTMPPDCGMELGRVVASGVRPDRWQRALDAVDAVQSGSYALPLACARADVVLPTFAATEAQCVIGDLAFVESPR